MCDKKISIIIINLQLVGERAQGKKGGQIFWKETGRSQHCRPDLSKILPSQALPYPAHPCPPHSCPAHQCPSLQEQVILA